MQSKPDPQDSSINRVALRSMLGVLAVGCVVMGATRPSVVACTMALVAILLAIGSLFIRRVRGEIVVLMMIFGPPILLALGYVLLMVNWN